MKWKLLLSLYNYSAIRFHLFRPTTNSVFINVVPAPLGFVTPALQSDCIGWYWVSIDTQTPRISLRRKKLGLCISTAKSTCQPSYVKSSSKLAQSGILLHSLMSKNHSKLQLRPVLTSDWCCIHLRSGHEPSSPGSVCSAFASAE